MTAEETPSKTSQRIDQWLWYARFFKTRTLAAKFVSDGKVRLTRNEDSIRVQKPSFLVHKGDALVFTRAEQLRIINVLDIAKRRGPAAEAQTLYDDQSPPRPPKKMKDLSPFDREKGAGRPTKKERRAIDSLKLN